MRNPLDVILEILLIAVDFVRRMAEGSCILAVIIAALAVIGIGAVVAGVLVLIWWLTDIGEEKKK